MMRYTPITPQGVTPEFVAQCIALEHASWSGQFWCGGVVDWTKNTMLVAIHKDGPRWCGKAIVYKYNEELEATVDATWETLVLQRETLSLFGHLIDVWLSSPDSKHKIFVYHQID